MSQFAFIDEACLATASLLLAVSALEVCPDARLLKRGCYGFTFYCELEVVGGGGGDELLASIERALRRHLVTNVPIVIKEMLAANAAAFLSHVGSIDADHLAASPMSPTGLVSIAEINGEYFHATAPLLSSTREIGGCKLCALDLLEKGRWRISGCAVRVKGQLKEAVAAFKNAVKKEPRGLFADKELALFDKTSMVWLPRGIAWRNALEAISRSSPLADDLAVSWVSSSPRNGDDEILNAHILCAENFRAQGAALPLAIAERRPDGSDVHLLLSTADQAISWLTSSLQWIEKNYKIFGIEYRWVRRYAKPSNALLRADWQRQRSRLEAAAAACHLESVEGESSPSQTGPLLEIEMRDRWGRKWAVASLVAEVAALSRVAANNGSLDDRSSIGALLRYRLIHSLERLMTLLLEQDEHLPFWLAPEQLRVLTVTTAETAYGSGIVAAAEARGIRAYLDAMPVPLDQKIFRAERANLPHVAIVGAREARTQTVTMRTHPRRHLSVEDLLASLLWQREATPTCNRGVEKST